MVLNSILHDHLISKLYIHISMDKYIKMHHYIYLKNVAHIHIVETWVYITTKFKKGSTYIHM